MNLCTCIQAESDGSPAASPRTQPERNGLVPIDENPMIGETPQVSLQSWLTPNPNFYVRNHFSTPANIPNSWNLVIDGHVDRAIGLSLEDFRCLPKQTLPITMECAGNNRSDLQPKVPGNPFQSGAVSTAIWGGVPLSCVLERAGIKEGAAEVLFEGLDSGEPEPGHQEMTYLRSLPMDVATHPQTLLAMEMNGETLSVEHGYPVRLIVPGWYGMASVKWLRRICVLEESYSGFFQTDRYIIENEDGTVDPVAQIEIKSLINWPNQGESLESASYNVTGLAWSGFAHIAGVEVSDDGGETWGDAELVGPRHRYAWQQWNFSWTPSAKGHNTLICRAVDEDGNAQPMETAWNRLGYIINGVKPVCVNVI